MYIVLAWLLLNVVFVAVMALRGPVRCMVLRERVRRLDMAADGYPLWSRHLRRQAAQLNEEML